MVTREYWCDEHEYFTLRCRVSAPAGRAACPECGRASERFYGTPPVWGFGETMSESGGIPDTSTDARERREWQQEAWAKAQKDLHPANTRGMAAKPTEETYAPRHRVRAARERRARRQKELG